MRRLAFTPAGPRGDILHGSFDRKMLFKEKNRRLFKKFAHIHMSHGLLCLLYTHVWPVPKERAPNNSATIMSARVSSCQDQMGSLKRSSESVAASSPACQLACAVVSALVDIEPSSAWPLLSSRPDRAVW